MANVILFLLFLLFIMAPHRHSKPHQQFYGTTTVGEKGQVVIPIEAREAMALAKGDKLLVFGMGCDMVAFSKLSQVERFASHLARRLQAIRAVLKRANGR